MMDLPTNLPTYRLTNQHGKVYSRVAATKNANHRPGWLVGQLLPYLIFWPFFAFSAYCSCLSAQVTLSITAPAHPHMIGVTINPDFSFFFQYFFSLVMLFLL